MLNKLGGICGNRKQESPPLPGHLRTQSDNVCTPPKYKQFRKHRPTTSSTPYIPDVERPLPLRRRLNYDEEGQPGPPPPRFKSRQPEDHPSPQWEEHDSTQFAQPSFDRTKWLPYTPPRGYSDWGYFPSSWTPQSADLTPFEVRRALDKANRLERERLRASLERVQNERRSLVEKRYRDDEESFYDAQQSLSRTEEQEKEKIMGDLKNMQGARKNLVLSMSKFRN